MRIGRNCMIAAKTVVLQSPPEMAPPPPKKSLLKKEEPAAPAAGPGALGAPGAEAVVTSEEEAVNIEKLLKQQTVSKPAVVGLVVAFVALTATVLLVIMSWLAMYKPLF